MLNPDGTVVTTPEHEAGRFRMFYRNLLDPSFRDLYADEPVVVDLGGLPSPLPGDNRVLGRTRLNTEQYGLSSEPRRALNVLLHAALRSIGVVAYSQNLGAWLFMVCSAAARASEEQIRTRPHLPPEWEGAAVISADTGVPHE